MLTPVEQMGFLLLALLAIGAAYAGFRDLFAIIARGQGKLHLERLPQRIVHAIFVYLSQNTTLKSRRLTSLLHLGIVWGFTFYFLVNLGDVLEGFIPDYRFLAEAGLVGDAYRLLADVLSAVVIVGVVYFMLRRFVLPNKTDLSYRDNILLHPQVNAGAIARDSLIVAVFILIHVGARFLGQAVQIAAEGADASRPFATAVAPLWAGASADGLRLWEHFFWWLALGAILLFLPYFPYTKHAHLFMAPFNFLTRPQRTSLGEMEKLDFEDESIEQFGASTLPDLAQTHLVDGFACIMCNRCQDVCPAYVTGKELSPSAYEVNKRFLFKDWMNGDGGAAVAELPLVGHALSESALWACTACGACIDICPTGNEPMLDLLDIRRDAVLMRGEFPQELRAAFSGMEKAGNPWGNTDSRFAWAKGLDVPTVEDNPDPDILYWVGCAASYDPRAQITARSLVKVLQKAGVNFAVLGERENCTGDAARRAGKEDTYVELAMGNVETLNEVNPRRIVVTCPHCLHNLGKEYHQFGGQYEVIHHTELIEELIGQGRLPASAHPKQMANVTFHDPCYLGRHNDIVDAPRAALAATGATLVEMPRSGRNSFCCGAGGAQFWKEEEHGSESVSAVRYAEATATGAETLAVGCPFCMQMFSTAQADAGGGPAVKDVVELIAEGL
jgi:Fe-S oxidoreductase